MKFFARVSILILLVSIFLPLFFVSAQNNTITAGGLILSTTPQNNQTFTVGGGTMTLTAPNTPPAVTTVKNPDGSTLTLTDDPSLNQTVKTDADGTRTYTSTNAAGETSEMKVTTDGNTSITSKDTSGKITNQATTQFNFDKPSGKNSYVPLQNIPLPGGGKLFDTNTIEGYLQNIFSFGIAIAGALAVIRIVQAGIMYMLSDAWTTKTEATNIIWASVQGLLLALCAYVILNTINPDLVKLKFNLTPTTAPTSSNINVSTGGGGISGGTNAGVGGTIANNALNGLSFPPSSGLTDAQVKQMIIDSGILNGPVPADSSKYFPNGIPTVDGYKNLMAAIANSESGFNPNDNTTAHKLDGKSSFSSEGLFSLSVGDSAVKNLAKQNGITPQEVINNPVYNTQAAVTIMKNQVQTTGTIAGSDSNNYWGPLKIGK